MAIVVCPSCGRNTLDKFGRCIHCNAKLPPKKEKPKKDEENRE